MKTSSKQAKLLTRKLTLQLLRDVLVYSIVFVMLAFAANALLVSHIANWIADSTSYWEIYPYDLVNLQEVLDRNDGHIYAIAHTPEEADALYNPGSDNISLVSMDDSDGSVVAETDIHEISEDAAASAPADAPYIIITQFDTAMPEKGMGDLLLAPMPEEAIEQAEIDPDTTYLLYSPGKGIPSWFTEAELFLQDIWDTQIEPRLTSNSQVIRDAHQIAVRDLSTYYVVRQLKIPAIVIIYLIGFVVILFIGFSRSMQYFDELSGAVASMLTHRDRPISLSAPLHETQEELNTIRLSSLADERAALAAEKRKDELVAYLAHDVRTPITSIIGYLSLLEEAPDLPDEQRQRYISTALAKSERLEELISEFFEITRYNLQAIPIERTQVDVCLFCQQIVEEFYPEAETRDLSIKVEAPEDAIAFVDPDKFARALGNIMRNAIAHANTGSEISFIVDKDTEAQERWRFSITDIGREISPAHLESIFDKFYREDAARGSKDGRAGLGLAIAKEIVLAHGGSIEAQSKEGTTTFTIYVPA